MLVGQYHCKDKKNAKLYGVFHISGISITGWSGNPEEHMSFLSGFVIVNALVIPQLALLALGFVLVPYVVPWWYSLFCPQR